MNALKNFVAHENTAAVADIAFKAAILFLVTRILLRLEML